VGGEGVGAVAERGEKNVSLPTPSPPQDAFSSFPKPPKMVFALSKCARSPKYAAVADSYETGHVIVDCTVQNHNCQRASGREAKPSRVRVLCDDVICFRHCCKRQA